MLNFTKSHFENLLNFYVTGGPRQASVLHSHAFSHRHLHRFAGIQLQLISDSPITIGTKVGYG